VHGDLPVLGDGKHFSLGGLIRLGELFFEHLPAD
jgi:hypothetical protein